ncbi:MAG: hypothetical protein NTV72_03555 [Candidatus Taylorbacteria bacterium]|nr:hypothetical protein [Candidatus Taylorbacteria bacterium]
MKIIKYSKFGLITSLVLILIGIRLAIIMVRGTLGYGVVSFIIGFILVIIVLIIVEILSLSFKNINRRSKAGEKLNVFDQILRAFAVFMATVVVVYGIIEIIMAFALGSSGY